MRKTETVMICTACSSSASVKHRNWDISSDRKQRRHVFGISTRTEGRSGMVGSSTVEGVVSPTCGCGPLKKPRQKKNTTSPSIFLSCPSSRLAAAVHPSIQTNADLSEHWTCCFWKANRRQRWPWSCLATPLQPQAVFMHCFGSVNWDPRGLYSLTTPPFLSLTITPLSLFASISSHRESSPSHLYSFLSVALPIFPFVVSVSQLPFFYLCLFISLLLQLAVFFFFTNELKLVYSPGTINCDMLLRCSCRRKSQVTKRKRSTWL